MEEGKQRARMQNRTRFGVAGAQIQIDYRLARNVGEAGGHPITGDSERWDEMTPWTLQTLWGPGGLRR